MVLGLLCLTVAALWLFVGACGAVEDCIAPAPTPAPVQPSLAPAEGTVADKKAPPAGPIEWFDALLQLLAVRPRVLPAICAGAVFLSMAAYSDNFTIYVRISRLLSPYLQRLFL